MKRQGDSIVNVSFLARRRRNRKAFNHKRHAQWATIVLPLTGHDKDTPSGCNNRSPLRERWVKRNPNCFSPVGAAQLGWDFKSRLDFRKTEALGDTIF
ncbi:MAG TPA: hypothetical protein VJ440_05860 [Candidatus Brocadiaceae bacterium]|nr:hypothetical protein [Candidatus Brocadiaceae bacterium]